MDRVCNLIVLVLSFFYSQLLRKVGFFSSKNIKYPIKLINTPMLPIIVIFIEFLLNLSFNQHLCHFNLTTDILGLESYDT